MKRLVITLGMHRSGTSLLSAALEGLGVEYGRELIGPAPDNPKGFWEDRAVVELNERMFQALGATSSTLGVDCARMAAGTRWRFQLQIARWLRSRLSGERLLGLKDPRLPRLMDIWSPVLDCLKVDYWLLIPLRNPLSVAASLTARDGFSIGKGLLLWYEHMVHALRFANGKRFVVVDYDHFLGQPEEVLCEVATWLGQQPDPLILERFWNQVFDPGLRHATYDLEALEQHPDSFPDLVHLYRILLASSIGQARSHEQALSDDIAQIDERFADLRLVLRQCGLWDMELWASGRFCQQQEARLLQCSEERLRRETELTGWISTLEDTIRQEQAGRMEAEHWLRHLENNYQERAAWISTLEHTIRQEQAGRAEAENWFRQAETGWQGQLQASTQRITILEQDLDASQRHAQVLAQKLDALQRHADGLLLRLEQMLASRSWRLTAPLRRCVGWWEAVRTSFSSN